MKSVMMEEAEQQECRYRTIDFEETELRLGLPLSGSEGIKINNAFSGGKRGFSDASSSSSSSVGLKLNLVPSGSSSSTPLAKENTAAPARSNDPAKPPAKAQVVGWPPVRSSRKNIVVNIQSRSNNNEADQEKGTTSSTPAAATTSTGSAAAFVKVSMDGAPYLRKVDLKLYKTYQELWDALAKMFSSFTVPKCGSSQGVMKEFSFNMNESKLIDLLNGSDYVPTYEDKDGDWMLVGDVPWQMFVESCKRLRIMKGSEAIGLAPKAVEKCKNRIS